MEPKDIENPQAEDDFRHQLRAEKEVIKISSNLPVMRSVCKICGDKNDDIIYDRLNKEWRCVNCNGILQTDT